MGTDLNSIMPTSALLRPIASARWILFAIPMLWLAATPAYGLVQSQSDSSNRSNQSEAELKNRTVFVGDHGPEVVPWRENSTGGSGELSSPGNRPTTKQDNPCGQNGGKKVYIPDGFENGNLSEWSCERSHQSENFVVFWGPDAGTDPTEASPSFNPIATADMLEKIYTRYIDELNFLSDADSTNLGTYKIIIVMNNTWGDGWPEGWAFGGQYDGVIGSMWIHPNATRGGRVMSHELAHSLQAMNGIQRNTEPNHGFSHGLAGAFWESHANFMRNQMYPGSSTNGQLRWWQTDAHHFLSTRHYYQAFRPLHAMQLEDGIEMVNRLWWESESKEHPLETYGRLKGGGQEAINEFWFNYAQREVTHDYPIYGIGEQMRAKEERIRQEEPYNLQRRYTILEEVDPTTAGRYMVPRYEAPQDYGINIIPLHPTGENDTVQVKFKGHTEANDVTGWRYGFVTEGADGTVESYGEIHSRDDSNVMFTTVGEGEQLFFVVTGAPTEHTSYGWEPGWPKVKRHPYEIKLGNAVPEGHQEDYRADLKERIGGEAHPNGGGFVASGAQVPDGAYVGPDAMVVGSSKFLETARVEGRAWVQNSNVGQQAVISGNATVVDGTFIGEATVTDFAHAAGTEASGQATLKGNALLSNSKFEGNVVVGGDAELGSCSEDGVYLQVPHPNNGREFCDGHGAEHPSNQDVNNEVSPFPPEDMALPVELAGFSGQANSGTARITWQTASETNNAGFEVQQKESESGSWKQVGYVESKAEGGTTTEARSYEYTVSDLPVGTHKFRLRQVDLDGSASLTDPVSVKIRMEDSVTLTSPAPNPTSGSTTLSFAVKEKAETTITLYNTLGQRVATVYEGIPQAGERQNIQLDVSGLSSGMYMIRLQMSDETRMEKMTVVR